MSKKFIPVKESRFFIAINNNGDPVPYFGFTYWKKQMVAKIKKEGREADLIVAPVVFITAQNFKKEQQK